MDEEELDRRVWDSYMWEPGGDVLRNLWGERDGDVLRAREYAATAKRQLQIERGEVTIPRTFDGKHLRAIHGHLFQDVYEWAGRDRRMHMGKMLGGNEQAYAPPDLIDNVLDRASEVVASTDWLAVDDTQFADAMAKTYTLVNFAHPFREGNGRAAKLFVQHVAEQSPYRLDFGLHDVEPEPGEPSLRDLWNFTSAMTILQADENGLKWQFMRPVFRGLAVPRDAVVDQPEQQETEMSTLDLYHRTTPEAAAAILAEGRFLTRENTPEAYTSNRAVSDTTEGYGDAVVHVRVDEQHAELEDEFPDGEQHFRIPLDRAQVVGAFTIDADGHRAPITAGATGLDDELRAAHARRAVGNPVPAAAAVAGTPQPAAAPRPAAAALEQTTGLEADR
ncbi:Fic/DOC family protein [Antribacter gilvus]|uniref:Fic/DOC family protein n=1 Tax=Antribacter gilvus TaxID=2304675 RepID=UPI000F77D193|nr:Fic family protein [Antribacter gilvus]